MSAIQRTTSSQKHTIVHDPRPDVDDAGRAKTVVGLLPPSDAGPIPPLTDHNVQKDPAINADITKVFKTTMGLQLGDNRMIPIELNKEKSEKYQKSLDDAGQVLKTQIEV